MDLQAIRRWPGKSGLSPEDPPYPAVFHMLDVAACAEALLGDSDEAAWAPMLIALHDLGKIGEPFRRMIRGESATAQPFRHWEGTEALLRHPQIETLLCERLALGWQPLRRLVAAIAGHHGRPPSATDDALRRMRALAGPEALVDAENAVRAFLALWPQATLGGMRDREAKLLSWRLAGLCAAADWIGSNPRWFPPQDRGLPLADHLREARDAAARAVAEAGLQGVAPSAGALFSFDPRPMQREAARIPLRDGPMLAILEDETGAGKTEAALLLAQRMMLAGKGRGLFFALPTMATADAMFARSRRIVRRLFEGAPSLTLAHGRAGISAEFREVQGGAPGSDDAVCAPWLADDRRRALLADVGVGTVDQALLAVLPTKFATLRCWGLASKILIIDEVHELGDPYMAEELDRLLRLHAQGGGSAILLSATIPLGLRARFAQAFEAGAGRQAPVDRDPSYPALTVVGGARAAPQAPPSLRGVVRIERLPDVEAAVALLARAAAQGAACVWVRNAVDEAIAACDALRALGLPADLLHARFALADRKRHEASAMARFGREDGGCAGRILVSTQVLESSLDLDFDVMVSDLAPMAALVQRAGRLWRHMELRGAAERPVAAPVLHVLSPDAAEATSDRWLQGALGKGAFVYPVAEQWRTARTAFGIGAIDAPRGLRAMIEAVHGEDAEDVPAALERREAGDLGKDYAAAGQARQNVIDIAAGYRDGGGGADDQAFPTRLGRPVRRLLLAREDAGRLRPLADAPSLPEAELLSEVSASAARLAALALPDQAAPLIAAMTAAWPDWKRREIVVCPLGGGGEICDGLHYDPERGLLFAL